jgi:hypothetical protein
MLGSKGLWPPFDTGLLRTACSHNPQKHSQSAHFSAKNGFLFMFLADPKVKNLHASKLASDFPAFDPGIMTYSCHVTCGMMQLQFTAALPRSVFTQLLSKIPSLTARNGV